MLLIRTAKPKPTDGIRLPGLTPTFVRSHAPNRMPTRVPWVLLMLGIVCSSGCSLLKSTLGLPDKAIQAVLSLNREGVTIDPVELQSQLIRFSDHYLDAMISATGLLRQGEEEHPDRRTLLKRRIAMTDDVLSIATGSNAYANLLDMIILVSLNRVNIENYWMPKRFGDSAKPLLDAGLDAEKEIWRIAGTALQQQQIDELRNGIRAWRDQHPDGRTPRDVGSLGFASEIAKMSKVNQADKSSVFNLLIIDPFAGLDPATSELANTRLFAERGLFLARRMPTLVRWETELLALQTAEMPQIEKLLSSTNQFSASVERFSLVSERLPALISSEREQIVQALDAQRPGLISLAAQTEKALGAGKLMSEATNATLNTYRALMNQLDERPSNPNAEPFRIGDYTAAAAQISASAERLTTLLEALGKTISPERLDMLSARADLLGKQAQASGKEVVDYAFKKLLLLGVILITLSSAMVLATCWVYWMLKDTGRRRLKAQ
jgi:hypothetical protein